jgi:hypothetical protein
MRRMIDITVLLIFSVRTKRRHAEPTIIGPSGIGQDSWGSGFTTSDHIADFNGDGRSNLIQLYNGTGYVRLSNGAYFGFSLSDFGDRMGVVADSSRNPLSTRSMWRATEADGAGFAPPLLVIAQLGKRVASTRADRHRSFLISFSRTPRPMGANKIKELR